MAFQRHYITKTIHLIAGIFLIVYALSIGVNHFFQIWGFGIGLGCGMVSIIIILLRYRLPLIFSLFSYLLLVLISFSHFSFYMVNERITKGYILLYLGIFLLILIAIMVTLSAFPLGRTVFTYGHPSRYIYGVFLSVLIYGYVGFLLFSVVAPVYVPHYIPGYHDVFVFLIWSILMWSFLLLLLLKVDNKKIKETIQNRNLRTFDAKKQITLGYTALIGLSTFFEAFRGLWWIWFGTAMWISLMSIGLWKIWKHVFDVPETKEKHMASSPP